MNPSLIADGYKTGHHQQYPEETELVYSNLTPRSGKHAPKYIKRVVSFGQQMTMIRIHDMWQKEFFNKPKKEVCGEIKRELSMYLNRDYDVSHFEELHDLGFLPIKVKAITEGELVPFKVPVLTIRTSRRYRKKFFWLTNYLETVISNLLWKPMTSATIAYYYRETLTKWAKKTDEKNLSFVDWQGHDFSMRGMDSIDAAVSSGLGHLTSFLGTDTLPAILGARQYYGEKGFVAGSVPATEHAVMCAGTKGDEIGTFRRLLKVYPNGILSVVSDTWDLWKVCTEYIKELKEEILARDGKLVIRPDSGDPVDILCGSTRFDDVADYNEYLPNDTRDAAETGVIELLWKVFGGTVNEQGYKVLDPHIGAIYGDSITVERAEEICSRLADKGFASTNVVLGVGSFTYQFNTRDTFGFAVKATYVEVREDGKTVGREIFKDPITDDGTKKSATGLLKVIKDDVEDYKLIDKVSWDEEEEGELKLIYTNGFFLNQTTLTEIRERLKTRLN